MSERLRGIQNVEAPSPLEHNLSTAETVFESLDTFDASHERVLADIADIEQQIQLAEGVVDRVKLDNIKNEITQIKDDYAKRHSTIQSSLRLFFSEALIVLSAACTPIERNPPDAGPTSVTRVEPAQDASTADMGNMYAPDADVLSAERIEQETKDIEITKKRLEEKYRIFDEQKIQDLIRYKNESELLEIATSDGAHRYLFYIGEGDSESVGLLEAKKIASLIPAKSSIRVTHIHTHIIKNQDDLPLEVMRKIKEGKAASFPVLPSNDDLYCLLRDSKIYRSLRPEVGLSFGVYDSTGRWTVHIDTASPLLHKDIFEKYEQDRRRIFKAVTPEERKLLAKIRELDEQGDPRVLEMRKLPLFRGYLEKMAKLRAASSKEFTMVDDYMLLILWLRMGVQSGWRHDGFVIGGETEKAIQTIVKTYEEKFAVSIQYDRKL